MPDDSKDESKEALTITKLIPQLFFDIIAWLIPGAFIQITIILSIAGPDLFYQSSKELLHLKTESSFISALLIGAGLIFSYITAIILNGFWDYVEKKPNI
jgi:hypothetical protein